jgi:hypothetical protein
MLFFLSSCGENDQNKTTTTADDSTTTTSTSTSTSSNSTIVTAPQTILSVTHRVSNFAKWKASYEAHDSMKLAFGIHNYVIGRGVEDSNMVLVATKVDDIDKAKAFMKDPSLKAAMQKGGVTGKPSMNLVTEVYQDTANLAPDVIRSMTTFTVKDWDTWKRVFESHRQTRLDNGVTDRVYGYNVDDNHKVSLVVAINDTAKARAFWNSDLLKQQRAESGATSQPQRFLFRVVQRY